MRFLKQFLYGIFYLAIIGLIGWGVYARVTARPAPSCHDGIQDQGETGIDCGGPCGNVCTAGLESIEGDVHGDYLWKTDATHATILHEFANVNEVGLPQFEYSFTFYDASNTLVGSTPSATTFLYPGQLRYMVMANILVPSSTVSYNDTWGDPVWVSSSTMGPAPMFTFQNLAFSSASSGTIAVADGTLVNQQSVPMANVIIDAIFKNSTGNPVGASETTLNNVPANGSLPFSISYPINTANVDLSETEVEAYATY